MFANRYFPVRFFNDKYFGTTSLTAALALGFVALYWWYLRDDED